MEPHEPHTEAPQRHLAFIGMAGSGKSAISRRIAARIGRPVVDIDAAVVERTGRSIPDIFGAEGEAYFRRLETEELDRALHFGAAVVIATGGGIVESAENRELLRSLADTVLLDAPEDVLLERLRNSSHRRPLLESDLEGNVHRLLERRRDLYRGLADLVVTVGSDAVAATASAVFDAVVERWPDVAAPTSPSGAGAVT